MTLLTKDEKKQKLLNISLELFHKNGMGKTSIAQITEKAQMGKSTFYEYFKSKEDIINQWFEGFFMELANIDEYLETLSSNKEKIVFFVKSSCSEEFANEHFVTIFVEFWKLAFSEKNQRSIELIDAFYKRFAKILSIYINQGIADKEFEQCDVEKVVSNIMAMIDGHWIQYMVNPDYDIQRNAVYSTEVFLKGISYG